VNATTITIMIVLISILCFYVGARILKPTIHPTKKINETHIPSTHHKLALTLACQALKQKNHSYTLNCTQ